MVRWAIFTSQAVFPIYGDDVRDLVIIGAGGHGRELLDIVAAMNAAEPTWNFLGFLDDSNASAALVEKRGSSLLGPVAEIASLRCCYALGLGSPEVRRRVDGIAADAGGVAVDLRHPSAVVGGGNEFGDGCMFAAGAVVTTNVRLGRSVHLNVGASVSHDCVVGDYSILAPGARFAGNVRCGAGVDVGIGAVVRPGVTIGDGAVIGAGAAVVHDVEPGAVVVGVPARPLPN